MGRGSRAGVSPTPCHTPEGLKEGVLILAAPLLPPRGHRSPLGSPRPRARCPRARCAAVPAACVPPAGPPRVNEAVLRLSTSAGLMGLCCSTTLRSPTSWPRSPCPSPACGTVAPSAPQCAQWQPGAQLLGRFCLNATCKRGWVWGETRCRAAPWAWCCLSKLTQLRCPCDGSTRPRVLSPQGVPPRQEQRLGAP